MSDLHLLPGDAAALKAFAPDLGAMTKEEVQDTFDEVGEEIQGLTEWQEALAARLRQLE